METLRPVAVVTDSATGIPPELLAHYDIAVVPFWIRVGEKSYLDGVDIQPDQFFALLRAQEEPSVGTGVPSADTFLEVYRRVATKAAAIVSIHIAGGQSGTCSTAQLAGKSSPVPVEVVDSGTTAMAEGFVVLEAARAAAEGASLTEVVARARACVPKVEVLALLETVDYAIRGGRLAGAARLLGSLFNVQPIVRVGNNKVGLVGQVRRRNRGLQQLLERVKQNAGESPVRLAVHFTEDEAEGRLLLERLQGELNCVETYLTRVPVPLGVHAGPGAIGVAYCVESGMAASEVASWRSSLARLQEQAKGLLDNVHLPGTKSTH